jgi:hypothetical protein
VVALYAGANKRPRPRDLSRPGRLNCLVGDFVAEDLFFNLVDSFSFMAFEPLLRQTGNLVGRRRKMLRRSTGPQRRGLPGTDQGP